MKAESEEAGGDMIAELYASRQRPRCMDISSRYLSTLLKVIPALP